VIDRELDEQAGAQNGTAAVQTGLWWENDPQLADRFKRRQ
jgi:hypothetical protein